MKKVKIQLKDYTSYEPESLKSFITDCSEEQPDSSVLIRILKIMNDSFTPQLYKLFIKNDPYSEGKKYKLFNFYYKGDEEYIQTRGMIGVIQMELDVSHDPSSPEVWEVTLEIGSRFDEGKHQYFLQYMLVKSGDAPTHDYAPPSSIESVMEHLLLFLFRQQLITAYRQGLFKAYQRFEHNDARLRGQLNIPRHLKENIPFTGRFSYDIREHTFDNDMLHLILHAYTRLKRKYPSVTQTYLCAGNSESAQAIQAIQQAAPGFHHSDVTRVANRCRKAVSNPFFQKYEPLRKTCLQILKNLGVSIYHGDREKIQGVLFFVPKLWEQFLMGMFNGYKVKEQQKLEVLIPIDNENSRTSIHPDFVFYEDASEESEDPYLILDAKYKPKWKDASQTANFMEVQNDYRQIIEYMTSFAAQHGGAIFPIQESDQTGEHVRGFRISSKKHVTHLFYTVAVPVPHYSEDESFHSWRSRFDRGIKAIVDEMIEREILR